MKLSIMNSLMPGLFMIGESDPNPTPAMSWRLAAEALCGEARVFSGLRHMTAFDSPRSVNPELRRLLETAAIAEQQTR